MEKYTAIFLQTVRINHDRPGAGHFRRYEMTTEVINLIH